MTEEIKIGNLHKGKVLAALYNASKPQGMGMLQYDPTPMTDDEADTIICLNPGQYFDYLKGRIMKVDLSGNILNPWLYDRDNGEGAAARALAELLEG